MTHHGTHLYGNECIAARRYNRIVSSRCCGAGVGSTQLSSTSRSATEVLQVVPVRSWCPSASQEACGTSQHRFEKGIPHRARPSHQDPLTKISQPSSARWFLQVCAKAGPLEGNMEKEAHTLRYLLYYTPFALKRQPPAGKVHFVAGVLAGLASGLSLPCQSYLQLSCRSQYHPRCRQALL